MQQNNYMRTFEDIIYEEALMGEIVDKGTKRKGEEVINQSKTTHINKHTHIQIHILLYLDKGSKTI